MARPLEGFQRGDFLRVQAKPVLFQGNMQTLDPGHFAKAHGQLAVVGVVHLHAVAAFFLGHVAGHVRGT